MTTHPEPISQGEGEHSHCWHTAGIDQRLKLATTEEVCCWCGRHRTVTWCGFDVGQHGPFAESHTIVLLKMQVVYAEKESAPM